MKLTDTQQTFFSKVDVVESAEGKDHRHGHRSRLRTRFLKGGADALADYELLELILCLAIPRRDVKPLSKELITHFGGYASVLSADAEDLMQFPGVGENVAAAIKAVQASSLHLTRSYVQNKPVLSNEEAVIAYLHSAMAQLPREQFRLLLLDRKNALIADEVLSDGTVNETAVYPREIIRLALSQNASALILVHNHPSGDPAPSKADISMTKEVQKICRPVGVAVHDHIIVGKHGHTSFRHQGLL